jgi:predicted HTH transcriptional regulator
LLTLPEDQWFERKSARLAARALADTLIGLANADGGLVVIGLHNGKVEGISTQKRRSNEHLQANLDFCVPPVPARTRYVACVNQSGEPDQLLVFDIQPSEVLHSNKKDEGRVERIAQIDKTRLILATLRKVDRISTGEAEELIGASRPTVQRELSRLKEAGILEWVGKSRQDPRAYWRLAAT